MPEPVEEWLGAEVLSSGEGAARLRMTVRPVHLNGGGVAHGGVLFALADSCLARAAIIPQAGATVWSHVAFIAPAHLGDELVAEARTTTSWGANRLVDVTVTSDGRTIAEVRGQARLPRH